MAYCGWCIHSGTILNLSSSCFPTCIGIFVIAYNSYQNVRVRRFTAASFINTNRTMPLALPRKSCYCRLKISYISKHFLGIIKPIPGMLVGLLIRMHFSRWFQIIVTKFQNFEFVDIILNFFTLVVCSRLSSAHACRVISVKTQNIKGNSPIVCDLRCSKLLHF